MDLIFLRIIAFYCLFFLKVFFLIVYLDSFNHFCILACILILCSLFIFCRLATT